jgi:hypothetical protein
MQKVESAKLGWDLQTFQVFEDTWLFIKATVPN